MSNFIGRVVDKKNQPIKDAKVSFEGLGTPLINYTDAEGIFRFSIRITGRSVVNVNIRVEAEGYKLYNRYTDLSVVNANVEEIRLIRNDIEDSNSLPIAIRVAKIGAIATVAAASIGGAVVLISKLIEPPKNQTPSSQPIEKPTVNLERESPFSQNPSSSKPVNPPHSLPRSTSATESPNSVPNLGDAPSESPQPIPSNSSLSNPIPLIESQSEVSSRIIWGDIKKYFNVSNFQLKQGNVSGSTLSFTVEAKDDFVGSIYAFYYDRNDRLICGRFSKGKCPTLEEMNKILNTLRLPGYYGARIVGLNKQTSRIEWLKKEKAEAQLNLIPYDAFKIQFIFNRSYVVGRRG